MPSMDKKLSGMLGIAMRAGQIVLGSDTVLQEIRRGKAGIVLLDADASENTAKCFADKCAYYRVPLHTVETGALDQAFGRSGRMVAAVRKGGFADQITKLITSDENPVG